MSFLAQTEAMMNVAKTCATAADKQVIILQAIALNTAAIADALQKDEKKTSQGFSTAPVKGT